MLFLIPASVALWSSECSKVELRRRPWLPWQAWRADNARIPFPPPQSWKTALPPLPLPDHAHSSFSHPRTTWANADQSRGSWLPPAPLQGQFIIEMCPTQHTFIPDTPGSPGIPGSPELPGAPVSPFSPPGPLGPARPCSKYSFQVRAEGFDRSALSTDKALVTPVPLCS